MNSNKQLVGKYNILYRILQDGGKDQLSKQAYDDSLKFSITGA